MVERTGMSMELKARDAVDGVLAGANPQSAYVDDFELIPSPGAGALLGMSGLVALRRRRAC